MLRRFHENDALDLHEYLSDPDVVRYEPYPPFTFDQCVDEARRRSKDPFFLAICLKETNKVIGNLYFSPHGPKWILTYIIGYVLNKKYHRKGYATEAVLCLLKKGFGEMGLHRIVAKCHPDNSASWRLLERCGFRREGMEIKNIFFRWDDLGNPIWQDSLCYALLKEEFDNGEPHSFEGGRP